MDVKKIIDVEKSFYERESVFACVQIFRSRAKIDVFEGRNGCVSVQFTGKNESELEDVAALFREELVNQQVRRDLNVQFGNIRDMIVQQAFSPMTNKKE